MKENSNIPRKELPERLQVSESAIQKHIVFLKEQGIITREGGNKYGKWKVGVCQNSIFEAMNLEFEI